MAFDFKKEYKEFYKNKPEIVTVPAANYIAVRGQGDPNEAGGALMPLTTLIFVRDAQSLHPARMIKQGPTSKFYDL